MNIVIYRRSNKSRRIRVGVPVATALCVLGSTTSAEPVYELLDVAEGGSVSAREINEAGQAIASVGGSFNQDFFWDGTTVRAPDTDEPITAINDSGLVVGGLERGFIWDGIEMVPLGSLPILSLHRALRYQQSRTSGRGGVPINSSDLLPFIWEDGTIRELPGLGGTGRGYAEAINEFGQVAGVADTPASGVTSHAVLWDGEIHDLGTLGGPQSFAVAINNLGQVVGSSETADGSSHAFLWDGRKMHDLGTLGGAASAADRHQRSTDK